VRVGSRSNPQAGGVRRRTFPFPPTLERLSGAFFLFLAWHGTVIAAPAASPEETAANHLETGNARLDAGDFAAAVAEYRAGFAVYPRASLLFNIGVAELRQEHLLEAAEAFEGVLARPDATPEVLEETRQQIEAVNKKLALLSLTGTGGTALAVDGRARGTLPLPGPLRLLPGRHTVSATREGHHPFQRQISTAPGVRMDLEVALEPLPPPPQPKRRYWLWGAVGAAVVAGAVIGYFALRDNCPADQCLTVMH
jgi:tetratricopeptide (TPR) repeat protein